MIFITDKAKMNCFAGLALMKIITSNRPKTHNMKTLKTQKELKNKMVKDLFQELFLIQIRLERYYDSRGQFYPEIKALIQAIDRMLEFLLGQFID